VIQTGLEGGILNKLKEVFENYTELEQVVLYGSRALGNFNDRSDIDLAVKGTHLDRFKIAQMLLECDELDIAYTVDLQNYSDIKNVKLKDHIDRVGVVIYP